MLRSLTVVWAALLTALPAVAGPAAGLKSGAEAGAAADLKAGTPASVEEHFLTQEAAVTRILDVADQRMALMPGVAATKWQTHAPITDPEREQVVIKHSGDLALPFGLAAEPVERVFEVQVRLAREWEESLTRQWQSQGYNYTGP